VVIKHTSRFLALVFLCAGCGFIRARNDLEQSKVVYKECLNQHPQDGGQCDGLRRAYEVDLQAYQSIFDSIRHTSSVLSTGRAERANNNQPFHCTPDFVGGMDCTPGE